MRPSIPAITIRRLQKGVFLDLTEIDYRKEIKEALKSRTVLVSGCVPGQMEHLIFQLRDGLQHLVILTHDEKKTAEILNNYMAFDKAAAVIRQKIRCLIKQISGAVTFPSSVWEW